MSTEGVGTWDDFLKTGGFYLGGTILNNASVLFAGDEIVGGQVVDMSSGGVRHQRSPSHQYASNLATKRLPFSVTLSPTLTEASRRVIERLAGLADFGELKAAFAVPVVEEFALDGDSRLQWTLAHSMGAATLGYIEPEAGIYDRDGTLHQALTVVTGGTPTATEILISSVADSDTITTVATGPGDAGDAGKLFIVRYYPLLTVATIAHSWAVPTKNRLEDSLSIVCAAYQKDWANDAP